jgi:type II secretory pathway predicted ATPase ExeA
MSRWLAGAPFAVPSPAQLREAFLWSEQRIVSAKTATVKLFGGVYETDPALAGRRVELIFDPFDLTAIEVRWNGKPRGLAVPQQIRRHAHPKAKPETPRRAARADGHRLPGHHRRRTRRRAAAADQLRRARQPRTPSPRRPGPGRRSRGGLVIDLRNHYGFTRQPFGKDLAPSMLHAHAGCSEAAARITWCISERALGVITGEVGAGKTVAARAAIAALDQTRHTLIYLANPTTGTRGLHYQIVTALGGRPAHGTAALTAQAAGLLAAEHSERARTPVVIIDEAHLLAHDQLEAIRMLTNSEMDAASPLACLLLGQPTLRRMLRLGVLAALDQRIALRYAIPAMTPPETASYLSHHLKLAGRADPLFSDDAITLIHEAARGLPRAVNNISLQSLVAAYAGRKALVDEASARIAVTEVTSD